MPAISKLTRLVAALVSVGAFLATRAAAQTCFDYVDNEPALVGIQCVQKSTLTGSCAYPADCAAIPSTTSQGVLEMHELWHDCFGNTGGSTPPSGRGQRWYAFHRQFEFDFNRWRTDLGFQPIEQLDWFPGMNLPVGHLDAGKAAGDHPSNCGLKANRPYNRTCNLCETFPQCLFYPGGGPIGSPTPPSASCSFGGVTFSHTSLDQFANVDDIAKILDAYFHGRMHLAVAVADQSSSTCNLSGTGSGCTYTQDLRFPACSPRDPMFWRLHKALDDVVRAWQDGKAVDVMMVIDRSGSMSDLDVSGESKFAEALQAVDYYADLLENVRGDGQVNRIGIVTYSTNATLNLPLTPVTPALRAPGSPFVTALDAIEAAGPSGCTGIGAGIQKALEQLCPNGGDCNNNPVPAPTGTNPRKAILLLTDGLENQPPCLRPAGPGPSSVCGTQCFGVELDYGKLQFTQMVNVGFGQTGSLNGELLTLLAERQGGIYVQNPDGPTDDLKYFFTMAFGQLTDEFVFADPKGRLLPGDLASEPVEHTACGLDSRLTFTSGWKEKAGPRELRLIVTSPSGALVRPTQPAVEAGRDSTWQFFRFPLPHSGEAQGSWRAQLIRPHFQYVNGFTPDGFAVTSEGVTLVRREIQRLCPDGCRRVLFYEQDRLGPESVYELALAGERRAGLLGGIRRAGKPADFASQLRGQRWDLIVYARMGADRPEPYDQDLSRYVCAGGRAIITDTRPRGAAALFRCARVQLSGANNWTLMRGDGRLASGPLKLRNPGHQIATYGLISPLGVQATANEGKTAAIVARADSGRRHDWFIDVLGQGLGKLSPVQTRLRWKTGDEMLAAVRILPSYHRAGGYDHVDARVEVEYPLVGLGTLLARQGLRDTARLRGELLDPRAAALAELEVPTDTAVFPLFDDGTNGDQHPGNGQWTGKLVGIGAVDGTYRLRFIFDVTAGGCTTRREVAHSIVVELGTDGGSSGVKVGASDSVDGRIRTRVVLRPADRYGNLWGPGRAGKVTCGPGRECQVQGVEDLGGGAYEVTVLTAPGTAGVRLDGFNTRFFVPVPCKDCPRLGSLELQRRTVQEHSSVRGRLSLTGPAPAGGLGGALIHLQSSAPLTAAVPESLLVRAGATQVDFPVRVRHAHESPVTVTISAHYGGEVRTRSLTVRPLSPDDSGVPADPDSLRNRQQPEQRNPSGSAHDTGHDPSRLRGSAIRLDTGESPSRGDSAAPLVLIDFSDYQCPYCGKFFRETYPKLVSDYVESGKVRYVFRDFPIETLHPQALKAAEAARCAGDQGRYWAMHDLLFSDQDALSEADLVDRSRKLALDRGAFQSCLGSGRHAAAVRQSVMEGQSIGVSGTPAFFIGRAQPGKTEMTVLRALSGARPYTEFQAVLDSLLAGDAVGAER